MGSIFRLSDQTFVRSFILSKACNMPRPSHTPRSDCPTTIFITYYVHIIVAWRMYNIKCANAQQAPVRDDNLENVEEKR